MDYCYFNVTCKNAEEATKIARLLLDKKLVVCAKQIPISSDYWWDGNIEHTNEIMLTMEGREDLFESVESELQQSHSYETFVLEMIPVKRVSAKAQKWMQDNLKPVQ